VREIGEEIVRQCLRTIGALGPHDALGTIAVFNPTPQPATSFVTTVVPWNSERPVTSVTGPDGEHLDVVQIGETQHFVIPDGAPAGYDRAPAEIGFLATDVPGYGYKIYRMQVTDSAARHIEAMSSRSIENALFAVEADASDGTLTARDKRSGRTLAGLNRFVDGGDRGDEYNYCRPQTDTIVDRPAEPPSIRVERLPGSQRLIIEQTYALPGGLAADRASRSTSTVAERIVSTVTLTDGVPRIDVHTAVFNEAEDHRLRVHFPSGVRAEVSKGDQHFGVIARPVALPKWDPATWMEEPMGTYPQKAFVSVDDGARGLTIANTGLPEYEAIEERDGTTIAVTLLRCVGWLSRDDISSRRGGAGPQLRTPGAQMHGRHAFDYAIIPHEGDWASADAHVAAVQHVRPMRARWNRQGLGHLDFEGALVRVDSPAFPVTCIKRAEDGDGIIVRLYNTFDVEADTQVDVPMAKGKVSLVNLNEEFITDLRRDGDEGVGITARPNEIVTLRFRRE
jgi:alpha-mannosidase